MKAYKCTQCHGIFVCCINIRDIKNIKKDTDIFLLDKEFFCETCANAVDHDDGKVVKAKDLTTTYL